MAFDQALREIGEFGLFQKLFIFGFVHISILLITTAFWTEIFILIVAPHRCKTGYDDNTWTRPNTTSSTALESHQCYLNISHSDQNIEGLQLTTCPYGWVYDYADLHQTFPTQHDWVCGSSWKVYTTHTCYWTGETTGFLLFGSLSDRFGRKKCFIASVIVLLLSDIGTFFTFDLKTLMIARFFSAVGMSNLSTFCYVLTIEYIGPRYRVLCLTVLTLSYATGTTVLPWIVYILADWHYMLCITWALSFLSLVAISFIPESASWLITRGRVEDAAHCMQRIAKINGKHISLSRIKEMLLEQKPDVASLNESQCNKGSTKKKKEETEQMPFLQAIICLFRTPNMRKKSILLILIWMIGTTCHVGNGLETSMLPWSFRLSYTVGGIIEFPASIMVLLILNKIGRRWGNFIFFIVGGMLGIIAGTCVKNAAAVVTLAMIMRMCNACNYDINFTMSSELFPTVVRGRGTTMVRAFGGIANAISPFLFALSERDRFLPLIVFGILCTIGGALTLFLPESAGQHLPHTLEEGEEFGKKQSFFYLPCLHRKKNCSETLHGIENLTMNALKPDDCTLNSDEKCTDLRNAVGENTIHN